MIKICQNLLKLFMKAPLLIYFSPSTIFQRSDTFLRRLLDAFLSFFVELNVILAWHGLWTILDIWKAEENHSHEFTGKVIYPKYILSKNKMNLALLLFLAVRTLLKISAILNTVRAPL